MKAPSIPYISNVTGTWITSAEINDPHYLVKQWRNRVRFRDGLEKIVAASRGMLVEAGPGNYLTSLAAARLRSAWATVLSMRHPRENKADEQVFLSAVAALWCHGKEIQWDRIPQAAKPRRISVPTYPFERKSHWVRPVESKSLLPPSQSARLKLSDWFNVPSWKPTLHSSHAAAAGRWLIFSDDSALSKELLAQLTAEQRDVAVVSIGTERLRADGRRYWLRPDHEEDYKLLVCDLREHGGTPERIIHLWSLTQGPLPESNPDTFNSTQFLTSYSLVFLAKALDEASIHHPIGLTVVSNYLQDLTGNEKILPEKATLAGAGLVIQQEYPNISFTCIDLESSPNQEQTLAARILTDASERQPGRQIAYRGCRRFIQRFEQTPIADSGMPVRHLAETGAYLITGGLGNVGLQIAQFLVGLGRRRLVLLSRSELPDRETWNNHLEASPDDFLARTIRAVCDLEAAGAEVLILNTDVADEDQMEEAFCHAERCFGKISGVFHLAAVTKGKSIICPVGQLTPEDFQTQFRAKVLGLYALEKAGRRRAVDFYCLFSSNAAILGGIGMAAYSATNCFLNAFASCRSQSGSSSWISACWDGWPIILKHDAMASERTLVSTSMDAYKMDPQESSDALGRVLSYVSGGTVSVSAGDLRERCDTWWHNNADAASSEPRAATRLRREGAFQGNHVSLSDGIEQVIGAVWKDVLGTEEVAASDNFFALGGNSLTATRIVSRLRDATGIHIPLRLFFENPTIPDLANAIAALQVGAADPISVSQEREASITACVEQLSDFELDAVLKTLEKPMPQSD
jgi:acyl transferase domain-containing protein